MSQKPLNFPWHFALLEKQVFLKYWFSDCLWAFPLGPRKASEMHPENISLLGTKEGA